MLKQQIEIINKLGLHARAAAKLVSTADRFESSMEVEFAGQKADAKSIMAVMMLAASKGSDHITNRRPRRKGRNGCSNRTDQQLF